MHHNQKFKHKWTQLLSDTKVEDMLLQDLGDDEEKKITPEKFSVIFVDGSDTVMEVLHVLAKNNISSVPVFDNTDNKFIGLVDMLDIVSFCIAKCPVQENTAEKLRETEEFSKAKIKYLVNFSGRNKFKPLSQQAPLIVVMKALSDPDIHRVPITITGGDKVVAILTQSRLIKWLNDNKESLGFPTKSASEPIKNWKHSWVFKDRVQTIEKEKTVMDAFKKIFEKKISGLAVVDKNGKLIGTVSAGDLKLIIREPADLFFDLFLKRLYTSLDSFLEWKSKLPKHSERDVKLGYVKEAGSLSVKAEENAMDVLQKLQVRGYHRLWVVDDNNKPIGVVSLCDVISEFRHMEDEIEFCKNQ